MSTSRLLAIVLVLLAGLESATANDQPWWQRGPDVLKPAPSYEAAAHHVERTAQQSSQQLIPPSMALRLALSYSPGSQGLGVDLVQGRRLVYAVKLKTGNRVHRVLVDARTGQILGD